MQLCFVRKTAYKAAMDTVFTGTVKSFNMTKGWGFVESPEAQQLFAADIFLLKRDLKNAIGCCKGDKVSFKVSQGPKGTQAIEVHVISGSGEPDQNFFGTIKGFDPHRGWGFIDSDLAKQIYGKDVFVAGKQIVGVLAPEGRQVQFTVRMEEKGPAANSVRFLDMGKGYAGGKGMSMGMGKGYGMDQWAIQQWGGLPLWGGKDGGIAWGGMPPHALQHLMPMWGVGAPPVQWGRPGQKEPREDQVFFGTIKFINAEKGWGHIECVALKKQYGKDMFVMKSNLEGVQVAVDQEVQFNVAQGPKGPHAVNLRPFVGSRASDQTFSGTVKTFNDTKGWGFIESEAAKNSFEQDIFLHKKELNGVTVAVGDQVQFSVDISGGRPVATDIALIPLAPPTA